jgi:hypothetical protein
MSLHKNKYTPEVLFLFDPNEGHVRYNLLANDGKVSSVERKSAQRRRAYLMVFCQMQHTPHHHHQELPVNTENMVSIS